MEYVEENEAIVDAEDGDGGWVDTHHNAGEIIKLDYVYLLKYVSKVCFFTKVLMKTKVLQYFFCKSIILTEI